MQEQTGTFTPRVLQDNSQDPLFQFVQVSEPVSAALVCHYRAHPVLSLGLFCGCLIAQSTGESSQVFSPLAFSVKPPQDHSPGSARRLFASHPELRNDPRGRFLFRLTPLPLGTDLCYLPNFQPLGMINKHVGYVFLVDWRSRIRWAAVGAANETPNEVDSLRSCTTVLLERLRSGQDT